MKKSLLFIALAAVTGSAFSAPYTFNARQDAMGGAGVTSANYLAAPFYNPALLANYGESDDFGILLPVVGVEVFDKGDLVNKASDLSDDYDSYQNLYQDLSNGNNVNADSVNQFNTLSQKVKEELTELQGATGFAKAGAGLAVALPSSVLSSAVFVNGYADVMAFSDVDMNDIQDVTETVGGQTITVSIPTNENNLSSKMIALGASVTDFGLSLARSFDYNDVKWSVGASPKIQRIDMINYVASVNSNFDNFDSDNYTETKNTFNLDSGVTAEWKNGLMAGLAVKNMFKQDISKQVNGVNATYELSPVPTASVAYKALGMFTVTGDVDLLAQKRFSALTGTNNTFNAGDDDLQMASVGAEFDLFHWAQLRAGYRHDLQGTQHDAVTAGFGLSPFDTFHFDVAGIYASNKEFGAVLQTALTF